MKCWVCDSEKGELVKDCNWFTEDDPRPPAVVLYVHKKCRDGLIKRRSGCD